VSLHSRRSLRFMNSSDNVRQVRLQTKPFSSSTLEPNHFPPQFHTPSPRDRLCRCSADSDNTSEGFYPAGKENRNIKSSWASAADASASTSEVVAAAAAAAAVRPSTSSSRVSWPSVWSSLEEETSDLQSGAAETDLEAEGQVVKSALWWAAEVTLTSCVTRHTSHVTRHTSHVIPHTSHLTPHSSHLTPQTSHVTRHTPHVARHTSHTTRRTSHVTRHPSHVQKVKRRLASGRSLLLED
jgi:hypothetical protein